MLLPESVRLESFPPLHCSSLPKASTDLLVLLPSSRPRQTINRTVTILVYSNPTCSEPAQGPYACIHTTDTGASPRLITILSTMPMPQPPPSPPVTDAEMVTATGASSFHLPPSAGYTKDLSEALLHIDPTSEAYEADRSDASTTPTQESPELPLRPNAPGRSETRSPIASADTNDSRGSSTTSPVTSPPYWAASSSRNHSFSHERTPSGLSNSSAIPAGLGITLRDNESSSMDERGSACWAKSVELTDYVTVNGSTTKIGAFVVWNIRVETLNGSYMNIRKRYSEFDDFRWRLMQTFPGFEAAVPELPPKSVFSKFQPKFLEKRRAGLQYFLNCIMLNPEFSGSPVLREFLFS
ncbi:hypothetical protein GGR50DRAFT_645163 [Xylaria sp. CBS 124048]|nr:hypothetical protein GGR50DRAFT_645163 [Xylaria sp. CBS 124048]